MPVSGHPLLFKNYARRIGCQPTCSQCTQLSPFPHFSSHLPSSCYNSKLEPVVYTKLYLNIFKTVECDKRSLFVSRIACCNNTHSLKLSLSMFLKSYANCIRPQQTSFFNPVFLLSHLSSLFKALSQNYLLSILSHTRTILLILNKKVLYSPRKGLSGKMNNVCELFSYVYSCDKVYTLINWRVSIFEEFHFLKL